MRRSFLALLLALPACFNPDDILPVHGSVTSPEPVVGQLVRLLRDPVSTNGLSCEDAKPFKETAADEAGNYSFDVFRAQATKLSDFGQFCFRVETTFPSGGAVFSDLLGLSGEVALPPFPDWRAGPSRVDGVLHFEPVMPLPPPEGTQLTHRAEWFTEDGGLAWRVDDSVLAFDAVTGVLAPSRQDLRLDDAALEDFSGGVQLRARVTTTEAEAGPFGAGSTTIEVRSGQELPLAGARVPLSRGLACPAVASPCPLTDGDLTPVDVDAGSGPVFLVSFKLATPVPLSAVVVRGAETESTLMAVVLFDADGGALPLVQQVLPTSMWNGGAPSFVRRPRRDGGFDFEPQPEPQFFTVALDAGVPISEVRVGFGGGVTRLSEVSLFE
ncbi:MAG: hypothetical protein Q8L48_10410 [Archangium sp.]|nr:hypothetical protein [Archangium sp.]